MNAIEIIREAANTWPVTIITALHEARVRDESYALTHDAGDIRNSILGRAAAIARAVEVINAGEFEVLRHDMSAGIPALHVACRMLCLSREDRMNATEETWGKR